MTGNGGGQNKQWRKEGDEEPDVHGAEGMKLCERNADSNWGGAG